MKTNRFIRAAIIAIALTLSIAGVAAAAAGTVTKVDLKAKAPFSVTIPADSVVKIVNFSDNKQTPVMAIEATTPVTITLTPTGGKATNVPMNSVDMKVAKANPSPSVPEGSEMKVEGGSVKLTFTNDNPVVFYLDVAPIPAPVAAPTSVATSYTKTTFDLKAGEVVTKQVAIPAGSTISGIAKGQSVVVRVASGALFQDTMASPARYCGDQDAGLFYCDFVLNDGANMLDLVKAVKGTVTGQQWLVTRVTNPGKDAVKVDLLIPATVTTDASGAVVAVPKVGPADMAVKPMAAPNFFAQAWAWLKSLLGK